MRIPDRLERYELPLGYPRTRGTVRLMAQAIRRDLEHPRVRARARELFAALPSLDHDAEIAAVWRHVLERVRYQRDPVGVEHITYPSELDLQVDDGTAAEDCDGMVVYAAALLASAGIPSQIEILGWDPARPKEFRHCALWVENPRTGQGVSFDTVGALEFPGFGLGDTLWRAGLPRERFSLDGEQVMVLIPSTAELLGCCDEPCACNGMGDAESAVFSALDVVKGVANQFGPYGQIVGGVVQIGQDVYDSATGRRLGQAVGETSGSRSSPLTTPRQRRVGPMMARPTLRQQAAARSEASLPPDVAKPAGDSVLPAIGVGLVVAKLVGLL